MTKYIPFQIPAPPPYSDASGIMLIVKATDFAGEIFL